MIEYYINIQCDDLSYMVGGCGVAWGGWQGKSYARGETHPLNFLRWAWVAKACFSKKELY